MRRGAALLGLVAAAAHAHVVPFELVAPAGAGNRADDAGVVTLAWVDGNPPGGMAELYFTAVQPSWQPWSRVASGAELLVNVNAIAAESPIDVFAWDAHAVPGGCWQPVVRVSDPIEGVVTYAAPGLVTLGEGPSIWVSTSFDDAGRPLARWQLDGVATVMLELGQSDGGRVTLAAGLDGSISEWPIDAAGLAEGAWYVHALAGSDAGACDAWSPVPLSAAALRDAGEADAGGERDGGAPDAGPTVVPPVPHGCGCGATSGPAALLALALLGRSLSGAARIRGCARRCSMQRP